MQNFRNENTQKQSQRSKLGLLCAAFALCLSALFLVEVYTEKSPYDWKEHVRIEEKGVSTHLKGLRVKRDSLIMAKGAASPKQLEEIEERIALENSLLDFQTKLRVEQNLDNAKKEDLETSIKNLSGKLMKLEKNPMY